MPLDRKTVEQITNEDMRELLIAEESYGDSWKKRGGAGAFMMLARKWDRLENQVLKYNCDIFEAYNQDKRLEGIGDDIRDLRRYLILVEQYVRTMPAITDCTAAPAEPGTGYVDQG